MAGARAPDPFNVLAVVQRGRLEYEAVLFAASFRATNPGFRGRLIFAEPQPGPLWPGDPRISDPAVRALLADRFDAEIRPFESRAFGAGYPHGNKIEGLSVLPPDSPFVFFDTDTLFLDRLDRVPFDFDRPTASAAVRGTWPVPTLYGPGYTAIWRALYDRFGLDFERTLDRTQPDEHWARYLYFNAGWFFHRDPRRFHRLYLRYARSIHDDPPAELALQPLDPWLDQVALPLVIHALGGGRGTLPPGLLDGAVSCHWRVLPLFYARESADKIAWMEAVAAPNRVKTVLKAYAPFRRMIYQGRGHKARALFDRDGLPRREQAIRNRIRRAGLWMR